ncbi:MAG: hypothetical protein R3B72_25200 [Polyangiaceae bacterium]
MFATIYQSPWHHPVAFWALEIPFLLFLAARVRRAGRMGFVGGALLTFQLTIMLDAWLTGPWSPLPSGTTAATAAAITFVVLGDLRYLILAQRFSLPGAPSLPHWLGLPFAVSLVVPIASKIATRGIAEPRVLFLVYELMFATLAGLIWVGLRRRSGPHVAWVRRLTGFEIAQYLTWATADVIILAGEDAGFALRVVANLLYYAAFVPFAWWTCPEELKP